METAPAMVREKLVFTREECSCAIQQLLGLHSIKEVLVLSAPELFQVYVVVQPTSLGLEEVITWISEVPAQAFAVIKKNYIRDRL